MFQIPTPHLRSSSLSMKRWSNSFHPCWPGWRCVGQVVLAWQRVSCGSEAPLPAPQPQLWAATLQHHILCGGRGGAEGAGGEAQRWLPASTRPPIAHTHTQCQAVRGSPRDSNARQAFIFVLSLQVKTDPLNPHRPTDLQQGRHDGSPGKGRPFTWGADSWTPTKQHTQKSPGEVSGA